MKNKNDTFSFEISLSVLNHLGRNLYRSFVTVLGEAISNSWDADAENVWIYINKEKNTLVIKDDGIGMTKEDFQNKFLKIGYSKRKSGVLSSKKGRPFIGRKGIGKLAMLSCAKEITVISKSKGNLYVGGVIDNSGLDEAITNDLTPDKYALGEWDEGLFKEYTNNHNSGTIIYFKDFHEGIKNSLDYLKKMLALYFRFSLLDDSFNIYLEDEKITLDHLNDLAEKTEFLWNINDHKDPYIQEHLKNLKEQKALSADGDFKGFIASVGKPRDLKVIAVDERVSVDLFVNGRLREKDILKHIPSARLVENYLYGQIHYDTFDGEVDRFTSSREGIVADDPKFQEFLENLKKIMSVVIDDWDKWRRKNREDGDPDNTAITPKARKSKELYDVVSGEYSPPPKTGNKKKVDGWIDELSDDAEYNLASYAECFISENLIRKYLQEKKVPISPEAKAEVDKWKNEEKRSKGVGNISIDIRKGSTDLHYLSMNYLANLNVDEKRKDRNKEASLVRDANEYKPIRDALAHTALLTDEAKQKLSSVYENIKGRINSLLS
ncbi:MAG: DNA mismatch repair protein [Gaiellales bacterium]|nr:MAG: DNA mismatch repair protein [Gaiellales bacterium]